MPAWRAIQAIYRAGLPPSDCEHLVDGVKRLSTKMLAGPTLLYYLDLARARLRLPAA